MSLDQNTDQFLSQPCNTPLSSGYFHGYGGGGGNVGVETSSATVTVAATEAFTSPPSNTSSLSRIINQLNPQPDDAM